jgi:hypothetical protein
VRPAALVVGGWGLLLGVNAAVLAVWTSDPLPPALLGGAAVASGLLGLAMLARGREAPRVIPDLSLASALVGVALAAMVVGAEVGVWLVLVGAGMLLFGLAGLARERIAVRREARR